MTILGVETVTERGKHQSIHTALIDDPTFQKLTPSAKLCFYTLKLMLGAAGIDVVRAHQAALAELTGLKADDVASSLGELRDCGFLVTEDNVLWLRNGLRFNPALNLDNENHRKSVRTHLLGLPVLDIVNAFAKTYGFKPIFDGIGDGMPDGIGDGIPDGIPDQEVRSKKKEEEVRKTFSKENESKLSFGDVMKVIRIKAHLNPTDLEGKQKLQRSGDVLKKWLDAGVSREEIVTVVQNTRAMVDAGEVSWIQPGQPFGLLACRSPVWTDGSTQPLYNAALDRQPKEDESGHTDDLKRVEVDLP